MAARSRNGSRKDGVAQRIFNVPFDGRPERTLDLAACVFDRCAYLAAAANAGEPRRTGQ